MKKENIEATSIDIEKTILGSFLNSENQAKIGLKLVHENDFVENNHKIIFKAIRNVFSEKQNNDIALISHKLSLSGDFETIGGSSYLLDLAQYAGTSAHIEAYCADLKKLTRKRQLISVHKDLGNDLINGIDETKISARLKEKIKQIENNNSNAESKFRYLLENNSETTLIKELKNISPGISIGFKIGDINLKIPGGAISIIAAPTSHGKTTSLINFSLGALNHNHEKSVYFFTYEESGASILCLFLNTWIDKILSKNNRESIMSHFREGNVQYISEEMRSSFLTDKRAFFENLIDTGRLKVFYSDMPAEELIESIRYLKKNTNVGLICIDYMQILKLIQRPSGTRQEELKEICLMLKDCAVETGLPILLAAQFNRAVVAEADLSPTNIREAGDIEQIANLILGMWNRNFEGFSREGNKGKDGKAVLKESAIYFEILKGRGIGNGHKEVLDFNGNTGKISNKLLNSNPNDSKLTVPQRVKR